jgi:alanine racemase
VLGRVGMQLVTVDVTDAGDVGPGTIIEIPARRVTASPLLPRIVVNRPA